jgi:hypothetical protein
MPSYEPIKDKFLVSFFNRQERQRQLSESFKQKRSLKTLPSEGQKAHGRSRL